MRKQLLPIVLAILVILSCKSCDSYGDPNERGQTNITFQITFAAPDHIADYSTGEKTAQISGVKIEYRQDYLTTISGDFLTAGIGSVA